MKVFILGFIRDEQGQDLVEYALIVAAVGLATGAFPRTDPWSFTRAGQPWYAGEWLSDVGTGAIHRSLGLTGVALFYGVAIAAGVWLWFRLHWALGGNFLIACAMAPL